MINDLEEQPALTLSSMFHDRRLKEEKVRKVWDKCYGYVNNWMDDELGQWEASIRKAIGPDKPALSFNEIRRLVNRVAGAIVGSKLDEKCYPRDDDSDWMIAEILTDLAKQVRDENNSEQLFGQCFRDAYIASRGFLRVEWSNEDDPFGSIIHRHIDPRRMFIIGSGSRLDLLDRQGLLEVIPMTADDIKNRWPEKFKDFDALKQQVELADSTATGNDYKLPVELQDTVFNKDDAKYNVLRYQYFKWVDVTFIRSGKDMTEVDLSKKELDATVGMAQMQGVPAEVIKLKKRKVRVCTAVGDVVLEEKWSEYKHNRFDTVACIAYIDGGVITGVVQDLLEPQDEKNKRRSQIIDILAAAASGSYFVKDGAFADIAVAAKQLGKVKQLIPIQGAGDIGSNISPVLQNLTAIPAIIDMELKSEQDMKDISGLQDASLGQVPEGVKSGRGIQSLQGPTETIIAELFDHWIFFRKQVAQLTISLIQQFYTEERRVRVLGEYQKDYIPQQEEIAQQIQLGLMTFEDGMKTIAINQKVLDEKLNDVTVGRYDVVIDMQAWHPSMRQAQFFQLLNMKAQGFPIKASTILKVYDGKGKTDALRDALEAEAMIAQTGMLPQMAPGGGENATPALPEDLGRNLMGAQMG